MAPRASGSAPLFLPFLYPSALFRQHAGGCRGRAAAASLPALPVTRAAAWPRRHHMTETGPGPGPAKLPTSRLNPTPDDYASTSFADKATLTVHAGVGGHGCISFLREMFLPEGPPNGGDGGHGGNVYIQAVPGETSLHKIARRRVVRAGRGKHGQGSARNGQRGDDVIISVPVGTIITEVSRVDPVADEAIVARARNAARKRKRKLANAVAAAAAKQAREKEKKEGEEEEEEEEEGEGEDDDELPKSQELLELERQHKQEIEDDAPAEAEWLRRKWVVYPGLASSEVNNIEFPQLPRRDRVFIQPSAPVYLDLSRPTPQPILIAAGGVGGLGNPHFVSRDMPRPLIGTKGDRAVSLTIDLELKLLADVGLVGLPNAGKSTLLRALSNSRARVGSWAFTTLQPNIGTVVLDSNRGRPVVATRRPDDEQENAAAAPRARFTIADIPGLIEGAHMDKGLGIDFLRHVERAGVLAFVIDLGAGDAVAALQALWTEVGLYARLREEEEQQREREARIDWNAQPHDIGARYPPSTFTATDDNRILSSSTTLSPELAIAGKPWFVVATKGDLPAAEANFQQLRDYLDRIAQGQEPHPSGIEGSWTEKLAAIPVSAIHGHGVDHVVHWAVGLLDQ